MLVRGRNGDDDSLLPGGPDLVHVGRVVVRVGHAFLCDRILAQKQNLAHQIVGQVFVEALQFVGQFAAH